MERKSCPDIKIKVLVRAYNDEPVPLFLYRLDNKRAYVGSGRSEAVIGLPLEQVFLFDMHRFSTLRKAFESGDRKNLESMYSQLAVNSTCNRYQDVLESLHDKENITDSGSAANSSEQRKIRP
jgi:hypothetical protein